MKILILITLLISACHTDNKYDYGTREFTSPARPYYDGQEIDLIVVETDKSQLPACNKAIRGKLAFIEKTDTYYNCSAEGWEQVELIGFNDFGTYGLHPHFN